MAQIVSGGRVAWLYQARRVATQANAGGGAICIDISLATGQVAKLVGIYIANSGTNSISVTAQDEDGAVGHRLSTIASAATTKCNLPSIGTAASGSDNLIDSNGLLIGPGSKLTIAQGGAGIQNDTLTIGIVLLLFNVSTEPTWDKSRSTNPADVSIAASTISAANTLQLVLV